MPSNVCFCFQCSTCMFNLNGNKVAIIVYKIFLTRVFSTNFLPVLVLYSFIYLVLLSSKYFAIVLLNKFNTTGRPLQKCPRWTEFRFEKGLSQNTKDLIFNFFKYKYWKRLLTGTLSRSIISYWHGLSWSIIPYWLGLILSVHSW